MASCNVFDCDILELSAAVSKGPSGSKRNRTEAHQQENSETSFPTNLHEAINTNIPDVIASVIDCTIDSFTSELYLQMIERTGQNLKTLLDKKLRLVIDNISALLSTKIFNRDFTCPECSCLLTFTKNYELIKRITKEGQKGSGVVPTTSDLFTEDEDVIPNSPNIDRFVSLVPPLAEGRQGELQQNKTVLAPMEPYSEEIIEATERVVDPIYKFKDLLAKAQNISKTSRITAPNVDNDDILLNPGDVVVSVSRVDNPFEIYGMCCQLGCKFDGTKKTLPTQCTHLIMEIDDDNKVHDVSMKYLLAIAESKWIVNKRWLQDSIKQNKLLPEISYEVVDGESNKRPHSEIFKNRNILKDWLLLFNPLSNSNLNPDFDFDDHKRLVIGLGGRTCDKLEELIDGDARHKAIILNNITQDIHRAHRDALNQANLLVASLEFLYNAVRFGELIPEDSDAILVESQEQESNMDTSGI